MNITIISGSPRAKSQSLKVSNWLRDHASDMDDVQANTIDLHKVKLPLFDVGETSSDAVGPIIEQLAAADAIVLVSPEWNGMMSHSIINVMHYIDHQLAHKPVMLVGVSAGRGGHYPLLQMRQMGYKNNHFVVSPENLLVQDCQSVLNDHDMSDDAADSSVKQRADYGLKMLVEYAKALTMVRNSGVINRETFSNGV